MGPSRPPQPFLFTPSPPFLTDLWESWPQLADLRSCATRAPRGWQQAVSRMVSSARVELMSSVLAQQTRLRGGPLVDEVASAAVVLGGSVRHEAIRALLGGGLRSLSDRSLSLPSGEWSVRPPSSLPRLSRTSDLWPTQPAPPDFRIPLSCLAPRLPPVGHGPRPSPSSPASGSAPSVAAVGDSSRHMGCSSLRSINYMGSGRLVPLSHAVTQGRR
jgi:hypothetical protein